MSTRKVNVREIPGKYKYDRPEDFRYTKFRRTNLNQDFRSLPVEKEEGYEDR